MITFVLKIANLNRKHLSKGTHLKSVTKKTLSPWVVRNWDHFQSALRAKQIFCGVAGEADLAAGAAGGGGLRISAHR